LLALPMAAVSSDPSNRPSEAAVTGPPTSAPEAVPEAAAAPAPEVVPEAAAAPAAPLPPAAEAAPIAPLAPAAEPVPAPQVSAIDGAVPPVPEAAPAPESPPSPPAPPIELTDPLPGGRVTWGWGPGRNPFSGREVFHRGIDIAAPSGTPITAPAAGTVVVATESYEPSPNSGTVLIIDNDGGYTTFFAHLASIEVLEGQRVGAGDVVATVGSTGMSTGPHLHFELRWQGQALDPARFVDAWR
jgi:murein DD-endopeptidase MepM/ murein hydrolase activator NlpD